MLDGYNDVVAVTYREADDYLRAQWPFDRISIQYKPASYPVAELILDYATDSGIDLIGMSSQGVSNSPHAFTK